jgi:hypothetical protein
MWHCYAWMVQPPGVFDNACMPPLFRAKVGFDILYGVLSHSFFLLLHTPIKETHETRVYMPERTCKGLLAMIKPYLASSRLWEGWISLTAGSKTAT